MATPAELRQFAADFEIARKTSDVAVSYLKFAEAAAAAVEGIRRTRQVALECGQALKRMHDSESFLDTYGNWKNLCRALPMPRSTSYRLMTLVDAPAPVLGEIPAAPPVFPLDDDDPPESDHPDRFDGLRKTLAEMAENDKPARAPQDATWVEKRTIKLANWFQKKALAEAARPHLEALVELAKQAC